MLIELLRILEEHQGGLGLAGISRRLDTEPSTIAGMLHWLVARGRVLEIGPTDTFCDTCPIHSECNPLSGQYTRFVLVRQGLSDSQPASACFERNGGPPLSHN